MSFSRDTKDELARIEPDKKCCMLAEIAGFLRVSGSVVLVGGGKYKITAETENPAIARRIRTLIQRYFSVKTGLHIGRFNRLSQKNNYILSISSEQRSEEILREAGILMIREGRNYITDGVYESVIKTKCCKRAYLRGLFLSAGSINNPEKGHHFEISVGSEVLANDIRRLINSFKDINSKITGRKNEFVVYLKGAEMIVDILALMGSSKQLFKYEDIRIKKDIRSRVNRISNCDQANIDKSLLAAEKQINAINFLKSIGEFDELPAKIKQAAELRLERPELSLTELGKMLDEPVGKSAVYKRLAKIEKLALEREKEKNRRNNGSSKNQ